MRTTLLLSALATTTGLLAQPVFQSTDYQPPVGTQSAFRATDYRAPGPATNGFVLDLSAAPVGQATVSTVLLPSATPYGSTFPTATHASAALVNPQNYGYTQLTSTASLLLGLYGPSLQIVYTDPQQLAKFPLALGTTWNDNFAGTQTVSGIVVARTGTSTGNYNGYGTVILPFGTFTNVARVEMVQTYYDNYFGSTYTTIVHEVSYLKPGLSAALFSTNYSLSDAGGSLDTVGTSSTLIDPAAVGIHENGGSIGASVWPNPATGSTSLTLASPVAGLDIRVLDAAGREVRQVEVPTNTQRIAIPVDGLAPGLYHVRAADSKGATGNWALVVE